MERSRRLELAHDIAARVQRHYGETLVAIGAYGSLARGTDGPYSDIEMHCVVRGTGVDKALEWSAGPWKAEVDVYSEDVLLAWATEIEGDWPLTHGAFVDVLPIYDPGGYFSRLRDVTLSRDEDAFERVIRDLVVGELYELTGKVRNARVAGNVACVPYLAVELAKMGMCLIGLANRHLYTTTTTAFEESLALPGQPEGYDRLCQMVMSGGLADAQQVVDAAEALWSGVERWAGERGIVLEEELDAVLARQGRASA
jgi:kanamycin nucleotidyltransferase